MDKKPVRYYIINNKSYKSPECFRDDTFTEPILKASEEKVRLEIKSFIKYE